MPVVLNLSLGRWRCLSVITEQWANNICQSGQRLRYGWEPEHWLDQFEHIAQKCEKEPGPPLLLKAR